jgi:hypothetical protein
MILCAVNYQGTPSLVFRFESLPGVRTSVQITDALPFRRLGNRGQLRNTIRDYPFGSLPSVFPRCATTIRPTGRRRSYAPLVGEYS